MAKIQDVINFFVEIGQAQSEQGIGDPVTPLALEKLLYYAQGWYLARYKQPLFSEDFYAWDLGPVVPVIYRQYKKFGSNGLFVDAPSATNNLSDAEYDTLLDVAREYMRFSARELVRMTHQKGTPWTMTAKNEIIEKARIQAYFESQPALMSFDDIIDGYQIETL